MLVALQRAAACSSAYKSTQAFACPAQFCAPFLMRLFETGGHLFKVFCPLLFKTPEQRVSFGHVCLKITVFWQSAFRNIE